MDQDIIVVTTNNVPGYEVTKVYGEVFGFNDQFVHLRMETFPVFGGSIDDGKTWDIRIDKFRLISNSRQGADFFPDGLGRIWAPARRSAGSMCSSRKLPAGGPLSWHRNASRT